MHLWVSLIRGCRGFSRFASDEFTKRKNNVGESLRARGSAQRPGPQGFKCARAACQAAAGKGGLCW
ncbi:hypothetical protein BN1723_002407 [Verticillium longisporum]|uniref:Uncharacterized protein n=1 Tax=Verticillium longisporum TaxID=100787 RepID=A0A0G4L5P0_VERLO|nr:hypothetical protein BN1723_002407 [Verticillium longisporum]